MAAALRCWLTIATVVVLAVACDGDEPKDDGTFVAAGLSDYENVCVGKRASNATSYRGGPVPHKVVLFMNRPDGPQRFSGIETFDYDQTWLASFERPGEVQLVGCLSVVNVHTPTERCRYRDQDGKHWIAQLEPITYGYKLYAAGTGELVDSGTVGSEPGCPVTTIPDETKPLYALPDRARIEKLLRKSVTSS